MKCGDRQQALQAFAAEELPAAQAHALAAHLQRCAGCRRDLQAYRRLMQGLRAMPAPPAPPGLEREVLAALEPQFVQRRRLRETRLQTTLRRAAAVLLASAFGVSLMVALTGWLERIGSFAAQRFSSDLHALWETTQDLWMLLGLLANVVRALEPAAIGLADAAGRVTAPLAEWTVFLLIVYSAALALGGWLCWRAFHQRDERSWSHAA